MGANITATILHDSAAPRRFSSTMRELLLKHGGPDAIVGYVRPDAHDGSAHAAAKRRLSAATFLRRVAGDAAVEILAPYAGAREERDRMAAVEGGGEEEAQESVLDVIHLEQMRQVSGDLGEAMMDALLPYASQEVVEELVTRRDPGGKTIVHESAHYNDHRFLARIAKLVPWVVALKDSFGHTPLALATYNHHHETVRVLHDAEQASIGQLVDASRLAVPTIELDAVREVKAPALRQRKARKGKGTKPKPKVATADANSADLAVYSDLPLSAPTPREPISRPPASLLEQAWFYSTPAAEVNKSQAVLEQMFRFFSEHIPPTSNVTITAPPVNGTWTGIQGCDWDVLDEVDGPTFVRDYVHKFKPALILGGSEEWDFRTSWRRDRVVDALTPLGGVSAGTYPYESHSSGVRKSVPEFLQNSTVSDDSMPNYIFEAFGTVMTSDDQYAHMRRFIPWPPKFLNLQACLISETTRRRDCRIYVNSRPNVQLYLGSAGTGAPLHDHTHVRDDLMKQVVEDSVWGHVLVRLRRL
jgi:hypothetical protein